MNRAMVKSTFKVICFILACILALGYFSNVLKSKDVAIETVSTFKQLPENSVDVLFLGSSHAYMGINTGYLWDNWGIASYVLGGNSQPISSTYFWLNDALRTQHPGLVVMDVFSAAGEDRTRNHIIWNTYNALGFDNKIENKLILSRQEDLIDHILEYPNYHSRYPILTSSDFLSEKGIKDRSHWKGFSSTSNECVIEGYADISGVEEQAPLSDEQNEYFTRIIELCKSEGIKLVFVNAPYQISENGQKKINAVRDIAMQHGIPFIDYNLLIDEIGITFVGNDTDLADKNGHLNYRGTQKYNAHLGEWLKTHFEIPDRRGDYSYNSWQIDADAIRAQIDDFEIRRISDFSRWIDKVANEDRLTLVLVLSSNRSESDIASDAISALSHAGIAASDNAGENIIVIRRGGRTVTSSTDEAFLWHDLLYSDELMVKKTEDDMTIRLGYSGYVAESEGVTTFLYDDLRGAFVEACSWKYNSLDRKENLQPLRTLSKQTSSSKELSTR